MDRLPMKKNKFKVWDGERMHSSCCKTFFGGLPEQPVIDKGLNFILSIGPDCLSNLSAKKIIEL